MQSYLTTGINKTLALFSWVFDFVLYLISVDLPHHMRSDLFTPLFKIRKLSSDPIIKNCKQTRSFDFRVKPDEKLLHHMTNLDYYHYRAFYDIRKCISLHVILIPTEMDNNRPSLHPVLVSCACNCIYDDLTSEKIKEI